MTKIKYKIKTNVLGNPDHGQNPYQIPYGVENITITAPTIKELQDKVNKWQGENDIGGGNWEDPKVFENKICIGEMSYNGRIWSIAKIEDERKEIL